MAGGLLPWATKKIKKRSKAYKNIMDALEPKPKAPTTPVPKPKKKNQGPHHSAADGSFLTSRRNKFGA